MKTILKIILALSLVSSVAFGAKIYQKNYDQNSRDEYIEKDIKIKDYKELVEFAKDCNLKLEYGKDENNVERIIAVMANGEKAIVEHLYEGTDDEGKYFITNSQLWVKKDGKRGFLSGSECPFKPISLEEFKENEKFYKEVYNKTLEDHKKELEDYKKGIKNYIPDFEENDYLEYLQSKRELKTNDDNATDENSEIRNWFINNATGLHKKVNEESKK